MLQKEKQDDEEVRHLHSHLERIQSEFDDISLALFGDQEQTDFSDMALLGNKRGDGTLRMYFELENFERVKNVLNRCADESDEVISFLLVLSTNYSRVSSEFMMPVVSKFGSMVAFDDKSEIERTKGEIFTLAASMQGKIAQLVTENLKKIESGRSDS